MIKLKPVEGVVFESYNAFMDTFFGKTEVWVCKDTRSFGITQQLGEQEWDSIILSYEELMQLKSLVDQAVDVLGIDNEK